MATITAQLTVNSDILEYNGPTINKTMTMNKAGATTGLDRTSGVQRVHLTDKKHVDLIKGGLANSVVADMTLSAAAKVYIKYLSDDTSKYVVVGLGNAKNNADLAATANNGDQTFFEMGRLYGNEWMIIPWNGAADVGDITVHPSSASVSDGAAIVEYIVFFE